MATEDVTFEFDDDCYRAYEITPENSLVLDLAGTVQIILDTERLRLGVHEIEVGLRVEGCGEVGSTTDDEITEDDLIDADSGDLTVASSGRSPPTSKNL